MRPRFQYLCQTWFSLLLKGSRYLLLHHTVHFHGASMFPLTVLYSHSCSLATLVEEVLLSGPLCETWCPTSGGSLLIRTSCVGLGAPPYCEPLWVLYVGPGAQLLWVSPVSPPCLYEASVGSLWNLCGASMCNLVLSTQLLPHYSCGGVLITTLL